MLLVGEVDLAASGGMLVIALAFGASAAEAGHGARASLLRGFDAARDRYVRAWHRWQRRIRLDAVPERRRDRARMSAAVLRTHEEKRVPGAIIASLSIPWGDEKGDADLGGYHLVWPRDLVESAGGLLAVGAREDALRVARYLRATQEATGSWPQNMWVDGHPYWRGIQLDEAAFPILLMDLLQRDGVDPQTVLGFWPMVRRAASYIVRYGPTTEQDRWEENAGYAPFTMAVEIAALLVAADLADRSGEPAVAIYLRETADAWNDIIDERLYVHGSELAKQVGVDGYYVRIAPLEAADATSPMGGFVPIKNRPWPRPEVPASHIVSPDALALVRFGLRAADDPRILDTVRAIDALLKVDTPSGPVWRRYNGDGYGEHEDGSGFDGTGIGRPWPLLTGERAHYEIAAGRVTEAARLLDTLEACASDGGLIPEQIWDAADVPQRELRAGRPSGAAMPLVWAHAEHLKLLRSIRDAAVYDMPALTTQRYVIERRRAVHALWRFDHKVGTVAAGRRLRVEMHLPVLVHWSANGWRNSYDVPAHDTGIGVHVADLPTDTLPPGTIVLFTFYWPEASKWEGRDFSVSIVSTAAAVS